MILHTLNKAQSHAELNQQLSNVCDDDDSVLLIEDGTYQALDPELSTKAAHWSSNARAIYILRNDAIARGINPDDVANKSDKLRFITYYEFAVLCSKHSNTISWY